MDKRRSILMIHGTDYVSMVKELLEKADIASEIPGPDAEIVLKPNLVTDSDPSRGATTHPELLAGTIEYLKEHGFRNIVIMEGSWVGCITEYAYKVAGYDSVCRKYDVPFVDLQKDSSREYDCAGMKIRICDRPMKADYLINMPVLKGHCQTTVTCALKNLKGIIPNAEKRRFHTLGLHKPIAHLSVKAKDSFIIVDNICGDLDFEEGGNPVQMDRILGVWDPVLCDAFVCESMGYEVDDVPYIRMAEKLGVGSADTSGAEILRLNEPSVKSSRFRMTGRVKRLAQNTDPQDACSACYGSLIHALNRMSEDGTLGKHRNRIAIGQGYKGKSGEIGVGQCTSCFKKNLKGCPPKASEIRAFLEDEWD